MSIGHNITELEKLLKLDGPTFMGVFHCTMENELNLTLNAREFCIYPYPALFNLTGITP
jgi:hypothetical protein